MPDTIAPKVLQRLGGLFQVDKGFLSVVSGGTIMPLVVRVIAVVALVLTAACRHGDLNSAGDIPVASVVPVSDVANAIKCELAETFATRNYVRDLVQTPVTGSLSLKEVVARKIEGEAGFEGTILGVTIGGTGGLSRERTGTNALKVGFSYAVSDADPIPEFCASLGHEVRVQGDPFVTVLDGIKAEHAEIVAGNPKVTLGSVEYTAGFDVAKAREAGGEVSLLIFKVGGKASRTNTSSQELTLEFKLKLPPTR